MVHSIHSWRSILRVLIVLLLIDRSFPLISIENIPRYVGPRATIIGIVTYVKHEEDGDWHFRVEDNNKNFIICEIIPELPIRHPKKGDKVIVKGVVRYDKQHKWYEIHPVLSVEIR